MQRTYYLYRHIRLDKNEPFYVGVGTIPKKYKEGIRYKYSRAYTNAGRNEIWKRIVNKTDYKVEILYEHDSRDFIYDKEAEFINLYGRIDLRTGTLSNLSNGGFFIPERAKGKRLQRTRKHINLYLKTGFFIKTFPSMISCAKYLNTSDTSVWHCCQGNRKAIFNKYVTRYETDPFLLDIKFKKKKCKRCTKFFIPNTYNDKFCSNKCRRPKREKTAQRTVKNCPVCLNSFEVLLSAKDRIHCTKKCYGISRTKKKECICTYCKKSFLRIPAKIRENTFCNAKCMGKHYSNIYTEEKSAEKALYILKKTSKIKRLHLATKAGFKTVENYKEFLENQIN